MSQNKKSAFRQLDDMISACIIGVISLLVFLFVAIGTIKLIWGLV